MSQNNINYFINNSFEINNVLVGQNQPTYFIADIGANHDGDINRAKKLIYLCADAGADAAKFQHFQADTIVSDVGFKNLDPKLMSHQANWKKSVHEVYQDASIDLSWTQMLKDTCDDAGITFLTTPYSQYLVDIIDEFVPAYKIGSGDITWLDHIEHISSKGKPVILACGASTLEEIITAAETVLKSNPNLAILQCNTNYTGDEENFDFINLNVLKTLSTIYPKCTLGLSDHTPGHTTAIGSIALGGRIVEKHFTDDNLRDGPDHKFAMDPNSWSKMVKATIELERSLGKTMKKVEDNEKNTVIIQRRCLRAKKELGLGHIINENDVEILRPCPKDSFEPSYKKFLIGKKIRKALKKGEHFTYSNIE